MQPDERSGTGSIGEDGKEVLIRAKPRERRQIERLRYEVEEEEAIGERHRQGR